MSTYDDILEEFGVPKVTLFQTLNVIFLPLKFIYLKHLWYLLVTGNVKKERVREMISL